MTARDKGRDPRVAIVGLGNVLQSDDAFGPTVARRLEARHLFPPGVSVMDLGTPGLDLHPFFSDTDVVILIDTVRSDGAPGELRRYDKEQILRHAPQPRVSPHDPGVKEALLGMEFAGNAPTEVLLIGVIPSSSSQGVEMTPAVRDAVPAVEDAVLSELRERGIDVERRDPPVEPDLWWKLPREAVRPADLS